MGAQGLAVSAAGVQIADGTGGLGELRVARDDLQAMPPAADRLSVEPLPHGGVAKVREAIERLKELRTALVSAEVTGKIDVREEPLA